MDSEPRYFLAKTTSKASSETPPNNADIGSNCQDEGSRLSGVNSDLDNPIGDRVREVVNPVGKKRAGVLVDCPMNMPAIPAVPTCMIPEIGIRDR